MNWLQPHYNLICHGHSDIEVFRSKFGTGRFPRTRLFEHTNAQLAQRYDGDLSRLAELPTLVVAEALPNGNAQTPAFLSRLDRVSEWGNEIVFDFRHLYGRMSSEDVFGLAGLQFDPREHSRTHWAVKEGDLLKELFAYIDGKCNRSRPKFFTVAEWPLPSLGHVAVMMPFKREFDEVHDTIKAACGDLGLTTCRVDDIYGPTKIMDDIFSTVVQSHAVVSDLTGRNPNVLYETGLAHALDRNVVTIVQNDQDVPFNLRHIRFVRYLQNAEGLGKLRTDLGQSLREILRPQRGTAVP